MWNVYAQNNLSLIVFIYNIVPEAVKNILAISSWFLKEIVKS